MDPSPLPVLTDSSSEGLVPDAPPRLAAEGTEELDRVYSTDSLEQLHIELFVTQNLYQYHGP